MSPAAGRWWVPLATAVGVLVLLMGMYAVVAGGGSGAGIGPDRDRRAIDVPMPPLPTTVAQVLDLSTDTATITGYRASARMLTIDFIVKDRGCTQLVIQPAVRETATAVTVTLQRVPAPEMQLYGCPRDPYRKSATTTLSTPLGDRVVRDAANGNAVVTAFGQ